MKENKLAELSMDFSVQIIRLELLYRTEYIDEIAYKSLSDQCTTIRVMLIASCRTAKEANANEE